MIKILFICHGNICRSPMAEFVMKDIVAKNGMADDFHIESAATTTDEIYRGVGNPIYPPARDTLLRHGINPGEKRARQMRKEDYVKYDFLIGMDEENLEDMKWFFSDDPDGKISLLLDHTGSPRDVADPWYTRNFDVTYNDVVVGCTALFEEITKRK